MKFNKLFMGLFGALALTACSSEENIPSTPEEFIKGDTHYMAVTIRNANPDTRAGGDQSGELYEEGISPENEVKTIRLYFFDKDGNGRPVKADQTNFMDLSAETLKNEDGSIATDMPNVEKILTAVIAIDTQKGDNVESLKSVVAIVNGENLPGKVNEKPLVNLSELRAIVGNYDVTGAYNKDTEYTKYPSFLMTSSTYGSDNFTCEVEIKPTDLKTTTDDALKNPVDIYVERVVAKVRMTIDWTSAMEIKEQVTIKGQTGEFEAIALKDKTNKPYKTSDGKDIYVIFTGWGLQSVANISYMFKNIDANWNLGWNWTDALNHRSYWALNPTDDGKGTKFELKNFKHSEATSGKIGTTKQSGNGENRSDYNGDFFYCQENAADDAETGFKSAYDPNTALTNRTQAYIGGLLVTLDGDIATPIELAEWGGVTTDKSNVITYMLATVNDQIYTRGKKIKDEWEETTVVDGETVTIKHEAEYEYNSIELSDIELVEEEEIDENILGMQNGKRYISRIQLKKDLGKTYYNAAGKEYANDDAVNAVLLTAGRAKVWGGGTTYYYVDLEHLGKTNSDNSKYGVVRNHIYDVRINTVYGLGTPVLTPKDYEDGGEEKVIIPEKPGDDDSFLGVQLYILSWRVVDNGTSLDW